MCGIAGLWSFDSDGIAPEAFDRFIDALRHRGPDGRGVLCDKETGVNLGHRRLAILDPSPAGRQPMSYANGRFWITYNGEVFNFLELRQELMGLGHRFMSDTDTEVILAAYAQWGEDCQFRFNGMWAFAIWDAHERGLFLSRDRFGIKPLHYVFNRRYFAFASEMKAFLALPNFQHKIDHRVMAESLNHINELEATESCLVEGVKRLVGGHCLTIGQDREPRIRQWWHTLEHLEESPPDFGSQVERFKDLFYDACRIRMRSDVPIATSLSGGLDSSAVLCTLHDLHQTDNPLERTPNDWQRAFVACYPGTILNEEPYARAVIEAKGARPFYREISAPSCGADIEEMVYQFEDIYFVLPAGLWQNYQAMRGSRVVVSLDGHGADELLGGYHFMIEKEIIHALFPCPRIKRYRQLAGILQNYRGGSNAVDPSLMRMARLRISQSLDGFPGFLRKTLLGGYRLLRKGLVDPRTIRTPPTAFLNTPVRPKKKQWEIEMKHGSEYDRLTHFNKDLFISFHHTILPTILRNFDRASMAHGVEIRMPFMDWRMVCFAFSLPDESKLGGGYSKRILREAMRNVMPEAIRLRTNKIGFTSPMAQWFEGPLRHFLLDTVADRGFLSSDIWNGRAINEYVDFCVRNHAWGSLEKIWPFLNAYLLMKQFQIHEASNHS